MYKKIGKILSAKGLKGEVKIACEDILFEYLDSNKKAPYLFLQIKNQFVPNFIEYFKEDANYLLLKFEDINTKEAAETLKNVEIYIEESKLLKLNIEKKEENFWDTLIGMNLITLENNNLGKIEDIVYLPHNTLAQLTYENKEILIPINNQTVINIDKKNKQATVNVAQGLVDIFLGKDIDIF